MSKKKESTRSYLHAPVPGKAVNTGGRYMPVSQSEREYTQTRMSFSGIDRRGCLNGGMRDALNVSFAEYPSVKSIPCSESILISDSSLPDEIGKRYDFPESVHTFGDAMLVFYRQKKSDSGTYGQSTYYEVYSLCVDYIKIEEAIDVQKIQIPVTKESLLDDTPGVIYDKSVDIADDTTFTSYNITGDAGDFDALKELTPDMVYPGSDSLPENASITELGEHGIYYSTSKNKHLKYTLINTINISDEFEENSSPSSLDIRYYPSREDDIFSCFRCDRCVIPFNKAIYDYPIVVTDVEYEMHYLSFPDLLDFYFNSNGNLAVADMRTLTIPKLTAAVSHKGRLYGGDVGGSLYVSEYNEYNNGWDLDTPSDISPSNAWMTHTQVDKGHDSGFVSIVSFEDQVVAFSNTQTYLLLEASSTFISRKLADIGCVDGRSVCSTNNCIFFVSLDGVHIYDGTGIQKISSPLGDIRFKSAIAGFSHGNYYLYSDELGEGIYVYNIGLGSWSRVSDIGRVCNFCDLDNDMYAINTNGHIIRLDSEYNITYGEFVIETEELSGDTLKDRRIKEINVIYEAQGNSDIAVDIVSGGTNDALTLLPVCSRINADSGGGIAKMSARLSLPSLYIERIRISGRGKVALHAIDVTHTYF